MNDISEHTRIADALRLEKDCTQQYLDIVEAFLLCLDRHARIKLINRKGCRILGYDKQELIGKNWFELCVPERGRETVSKVFNQVVTGAVDFPEYFESHILSHSGQERLIAWHNAPLRDANGVITGTLSSGQDITEQRKTEQTLRKLSQAVEQSPEMILITNSEGTIEYVNPSFTQISGFTTADAIGKKTGIMKSEKTAQSVYDELWHTIKCGKIWRGKLYNRRKNGSYYWNLVEISPIFSEQGQITHFLAIQKDITDRIEAEKRLRENQHRLRISERRYRVCYDATPSMFFTVDKDGKIKSANRFGAEKLGYSVEELIATPLSRLHLECDKRSDDEYLAACLNKPEVMQRCEIRMVRKDGTLFWAKQSARAIENTDGEPRVFIVCEDITQSRDLSQQLSYQASHDALTGLVNRREFEKRLHRILETVHTNQSSHALCYLDLDQFKVINDTCGHVAGDELLRQLADLLRERIRKRDTFARLGGDEFGILLEHCSLEQASRVANTMRESIQDFRFSWGRKNFNVGASIGLVPITKASSDLAEVLSAADSACYTAKEQGRNRIHIYQHDDAELVRWRRQIQWVSPINQALEENRLQLHFQPIVPIKHCAEDRVNYELLIRMEDVTGCPVPPGTFLPAAERYNLATKLDRWVIETALKWLNRYPQHLERLSLCFINLSGQSIGDHGLLKFIRRQFDEMNVPSHKICFEVTETAAIANLSRANHFIRELKRRGCRFALDDFGSGLSSFAYLKNLPVDFLKIDGLFVKDIVDDPIDLAMVRSINDIGHVMGKQTIAEFVENEAILSALRRIGVDYAQGYGIARPRELAKILEIAHPTKPYHARLVNN